ncbi:MAG: Helix-turn-helix protein [Actinomycetota bacterium]|nr:Helix-turn-helix protein [Actinomycetota bacterium]
MTGSLQERLTRSDGLSTRLHQLRRGAHLTGVRLASSADWPQSKISKIELGKQMPTEDDVTAWATICRAAPETLVELLALQRETLTEHRLWRQRARVGHVANQNIHNRLTANATRIRTLELTVVPGLLQIPEYASAKFVEGGAHGYDPAEIPAAVAARLQRQQHLYDPGKTFDFLILEAALHLLYCSPETMIAQLDRLLPLTAGPANITLGIIPFGIRLHSEPMNRVVVYDETTAVVETQVGETTHHGEQTTAYVQALERLLRQAHTGEDARALITHAMSCLRRQGCND